MRGDWPSAGREFKRAIELNPNSALSHTRYADYLETIGRFNESMAEAQRAQELDPLSPEIVSRLGLVYLSTRRYDESIAQFQKALIHLQAQSRSQRNPRKPEHSRGLSR